VRLDQKGLENALISLNLSLQLLVILWTHSRLPVIWRELIDIYCGSVGAQDGPTKTALLKSNDV
jgi:hypothetical protein